MLEKTDFTMTALRMDVLSILRKARKPLKAYEILEKLKRKRPNAQPPTVYRVLDFLIDKHVIHQINSNHSYTLCQLDPAIFSKTEADIDAIFICQKCEHVDEISDPVLSLLIKQLSEKNNFHFGDSSVEFPGTCGNCRG